MGSIYFHKSPQYKKRDYTDFLQVKYFSLGYFTWTFLSIGNPQVRLTLANKGGGIWDGQNQANVINGQPLIQSYTLQNSAKNVNHISYNTKSMHLQHWNTNINVDLKDTIV